MKSMDTQTLKPRIERFTKQWAPESYIHVPSLGELVSFGYPAFGPGNYQDVGSAVLKARLKLASGEQNASLLNAVYLSDDNEFKESLEANLLREYIIKNRRLWVFRRNVWTPRDAKNAGVYVQHDGKAKGMSETLRVCDLEDALSGGTTEKGVRFSEDRKTAFAVYNTMQGGSQDSATLAKNGFVIASYDIEGAENLAKVSGTFRLNPYVSLVNNTGKNPIQSLSALGRGWYDFDMLCVYGGTDGSSRDGYTLGADALQKSLGDKQ
jgi:hypothetical protein